MNGQTLWAIATAYGVTVDDIVAWNNLTSSTSISVGEKLLIPVKNSEGNVPTPDLSETIYPTSDSKGNYYHVVKEGDTPWGIADYWQVTLSAMLSANGLTENSSIGLGWDLQIPITATMTLEPSQTPVPSLTPSQTFAPTLTITTPIITTTITASANSQRHPNFSFQTWIFITIGILIFVGIVLVVIDRFKN